MTKTGKTKSEIIKLIGSGKKTMSELSAKLGLAPSTVSQHLQELKDNGVISEVDNPHIKKWKYYKINSPADGPGEAQANTASAGRSIPRQVYYLGILVMAAIAGYLVISSMPAVHSSGQLSGSEYVPLMITDPPIVPNGTTALYISYSSVGIRFTSDGKTSWDYSNTSGTINALSLVNASQVIGGITLPNSSVIDSAVFNISSASIVINGTTYGVAVAQHQISASVTGSLNGSSGVLMALSPTVITSYTSNSTIFVMVPSLSAVIVQRRPPSNGYNVGQNVALMQSDRHELDTSGPNVSITGASLSYTNGTLDMQVSVHNNGNSSATITNLLVLGSETPTVSINSSCSANANTYNGPTWCRLLVKGHSFETQQPPGLGMALVQGAGAAASGYHGNFIYTSGAFPGSSVQVGGNAQAQGIRDPADVVRISFNGSLNTTIIVRHIPEHIMGNLISGTTSNASLYEQSGEAPMPQAISMRIIAPFGGNSSTLGNSTIRFNSSAVARILLPSDVNNDIRSGGYFIASIDVLRALYFSVYSNGTLGMFGPDLRFRAQALTPSAVVPGYVLKAGQSVVLSYDQRISSPARIGISLTPGSRYVIRLIGEDGAHATVEVNAS